MVVIKCKWHLVSVIALKFSPDDPSIPSYCLYQERLLSLTFCMSLSTILVSIFLSISINIKLSLEKYGNHTFSIKNITKHKINFIHWQFSSLSLLLFICFSITMLLYGTFRTETISWKKSKSKSCLTVRG